MQKHLALIVDDEPDICELLELTLNRMDINTLSAGDLKSAYKHLNEQKISICLTDMRLPDGNGLDLVKKVQQQHSHIPIAMISAHGNMDTAIEALKSGAFDFVSKPVVLAELRNLVNSAIKLAEQNNPQQSGNSAKNNRNSSAAYKQGQTELPEDCACKQPDKKQRLLGTSSQIEKTRQMIHKLAKSQAPIHISGESGTGKELAACQIHTLSSRSDKAFVPVNCGAIPSELMESEFFGHKKGSFTGAIKDKKGLFLVANGGTLFLDEVADLPLNMQVKLLRAIQEKSIRPVGSEQEISIDVRIISATHKNLKQLVTEEKFRQDLYYRINVIELFMPSLKERPEDIETLSRHFLDRMTTHQETINISQSALEALQHYAFPGNVRELENILERAVTLCDNHLITPEDLNLLHTPLLHQDNSLSNIHPGITSSDQPKDQEESAIQASGDIDPNKAAESKGLPNKDQIIDTLESTKWNRKAAASLLGITYRQLRYRLKKLGLE